MRGVQGHGHAAGLPAAEEPAHEVMARSAQQRDAFAGAGAERGGDRDGVTAEVSGGRLPSWIDDRRPVHAEGTQRAQPQSAGPARNSGSSATTSALVGSKLNQPLIGRLSGSGSS